MASKDARLNYWRQLDILCPDDFQRQIVVVGLGAIGSNFVDTAIRAGMHQLVGIDFDQIEPHNIPNQAFNLGDIGKKKTDAAARMAKDMGVDLITMTDKVENIKITSPSYLVLAVDSMKFRKTLWESGAKLNPHVRLIEARMDAETGTFYCIDTTSSEHIEYYEKEWYSDEKAGESACTNKACITTARAMCSYMVHAIISWEKHGAPPDRRLFLSMRPPILERVKF